MTTTEDPPPTGGGGGADEPDPFEVALARLQTTTPSAMGEFGSVVDGIVRRSSANVGIHSPIDRRIILGGVAAATAADVSDAVRSATQFASEWGSVPWTERTRIVRRAAEVLAASTHEHAAIMAMEVGKTRPDALGDVEEAVAMLEYYCDWAESTEVFERPLPSLTAPEHNVSMMRPYGAWGVIGPFNFPMTVPAGHVAAALLAGNTVILKPSEQAQLVGVRLYSALRTAGVPDRALQLLLGPGRTAGRWLVGSAGLGGLTFTGSRASGKDVVSRFRRGVERPALLELGGKNAVVISKKANLDGATTGVVRAAFGYAGQRCSATSRLYIEAPAYDEVLELLVAKTEALRVGTPLDPDTFVGPLIDESALRRFESAIASVRDAGGSVLVGGERLTSGVCNYGCYVMPAIVEAPLSHASWERELFVPLLSIAPVASVDEGLDRANRTDYGLAAGFFSEDEGEIERFFQRAAAGVLFANRYAGATTGSWVGTQPFVGWKGSGSAGRGAGGPYYVETYMQEQSRTRYDIAADASQ